jgi:hypothetical protein
MNDFVWKWDRFKMNHDWPIALYRRMYNVSWIWSCTLCTTWWTSFSSNLAGVTYTIDGITYFAYWIRCSEWNALTKDNRLSGVMVNLFFSSVVDRGVYPLSDQTTVLLECGRSWSILSDQTTVLLECGRLWIPYLTTKKFGFVASSLRGVRANNSRLRIRIITRVNVVSTYWMLLQSASTIEIQHSVLV